MSELKEHRFIGTDELFHDANAGALYYEKSEADKVIAEKDAEIERLKAIRKVHVEAIESMGAGLLQDEEELRHQKYKRCLAMADMCAERRMYWTYRLQDDGDKGYSKDYKFGKNCFWRKWCVRWLALADKFKDKEAK